jgi:uncharacterized membrane protein YfcA
MNIVKWIFIQLVRLAWWLLVLYVGHSGFIILSQVGEAETSMRLSLELISGAFSLVVAILCIYSALEFREDKGRKKANYGRLERDCN